MGVWVWVGAWCWCCNVGVTDWELRINRALGVVFIADDSQGTVKLLYTTRELQLAVACKRFAQSVALDEDIGLPLLPTYVTYSEATLVHGEFGFFLASKSRHPYAHSSSLNES